MSELVEVGSFLTPVQAELARLYLGSGGVDAEVFGTIAFGNEGGPVRVMVLKEDFAEAKKLLREYKP